MKVAVQQIDIAWEDVPRNLETIIAGSEQAKGNDLCLFPEMAACGFSMRSVDMAKACAEVPQTLRELAGDLHMWIGTSFPEQVPGEALPYNCFALAGPQGQWQQYRKIHPFSLAKEDRYFQAGAQPLRVKIADLNCSLWVCYDLRFANAFWSQAPQTQAHLVVANWPTKRRHAWKTLLRARAIENQAYVVGCNRVGRSPDLDYCGDSCILDPLGRALATASHAPSLLQAELCPGELQRIREKMPFLKDRRSGF